MKIQTIHKNAMGQVLNETSATGFRITDNQGHTVDVVIEDGRAVLRTSRGYKTLLAVRDEPAPLEGRKITGIIMDEDHADTVLCYGCNKNVYWLAPDGRCKDCTRMTPEEVRGS